MPISVGENPQSTPYINKFIGFADEGHRGIVLALNTDRTEAIILAMTASTAHEDGITWGAFYHVREDDRARLYLDRILVLAGDPPACGEEKA